MITESYQMCEPTDPGCIVRGIVEPDIQYEKRILEAFADALEGRQTVKSQVVVAENSPESQGKRQMYVAENSPESQGKRQMNVAENSPESQDKRISVLELLRQLLETEEE